MITINELIEALNDHFRKHHILFAKDRFEGTSITIQYTPPSLPKHKFIDCILTTWNNDLQPEVIKVFKKVGINNVSFNNNRSSCWAFSDPNTLAYTVPKKDKA